MKNLILVGIMIMSAWTMMGQKGFYLTLNHKFLGEFGTTQMITSAPNGVSYKVKRLEYYLSNFSIVKKDGSKVAIADSYVLANVDETTPHKVGQIDINSTDADSLVFYIGVPPNLNHEDPALYHGTHPLGLHEPSMHWGWAGGYRFIAFEGYTANTSNGQYNKTWEIHALGDPNFLRVSIPVTTISQTNNSLSMTLIADYGMALTNIDLSTGVFSHGEKNESKQLIKNFTQTVFSNPNSPSANVEVKLSEISISPNPANDYIRVLDVQLSDNAMALIYDANGKVIMNINLDQNQQINVAFLPSGAYTVALQEGRKVIGAGKFLIQR